MRLSRGRRWLVPGALALLVPAVVAGWTLTAVAAASPSPGASPTALPGDPAKGEQLFGSSGCTACHGANLEGGVGPRLNPIQNLGNTSDPLSPDYLITTITNGLQGVACGQGFTGCQMPPKGGAAGLTDQDIKDLASFIIQSNSIPAGERPLGPVDLARSDVFWISVSILAMVFVTILLSRYNMRWIDRRAARQRERERTD